MNMQYSLIQKLMIYGFQPGHNAMETIKNICCVKVEGPVNHTTLTKWSKKFHSDCNNLNDQTRSNRFETLDFKAILQANEANLASNCQRVPGGLSISQFSMVHHLHFCKSIRSCQIVLHVTKILQNFWLTQIVIPFESSL